MELVTQAPTQIVEQNVNIGQVWMSKRFRYQPLLGRVCISDRQNISGVEVVYFLNWTGSRGHMPLSYFLQQYDWITNGQNP